MKILMINKFLYPNGGSETYIFKLGDVLKTHGHEVQYFGMEHKGRCVGNAVNAYTSDMDFHGGSKLAKLTYPIKTIYSTEARKKIRLVLEDFKPDVCHINNFNYQLTPSIILEIRKWEKDTGHKVKIIFTAHDYQLVCPNHMMNNPNTHLNCEKCAYGAFLNCTKGKCIHGSTAKSVIGTMEATFWKLMGTYKQIDTIICPTQFMKSKMDCNPVFASKTVAMLNFIESVERKDTAKKDYVLYFGRFSEEKGIKTLISVCKGLLCYSRYLYCVGETWQTELRNDMAVTVYDAHLSYALYLCCCIEKRAAENWNNNCLDSYSSGNRNQHCRSSDCGGCHEKVEISRVSSISREIRKNKVI